METIPIGMPHLNEPAPDFEAKTTHGKRKLADYKGKWLILFSHPGDFTPVCTTEFIAFAKAYPEFQKLNCDLLGLSVDSTLSHIAWDDPTGSQRYLSGTFNFLYRRQRYIARYGLLSNE